MNKKISEVIQMRKWLGLSLFFIFGAGIAKADTVTCLGGGCPAVPVSLSSAASGVTAGAYTNTNLTVDVNGRITAAANGTGGGGGAATASLNVSTGAGGPYTTISSFTVISPVNGPLVRVSGSSGTVDLSTVSMTASTETFTGGKTLQQPTTIQVSIQSPNLYLNSINAYPLPLKLGNNAAGTDSGIGFQNGSASTFSVILGNSNNNTMKFGVRGKDLITLDGGLQGAVGISCPTPNAALHISSGAGAGSVFLLNVSTGNFSIFRVVGDSIVCSVPLYLQDGSLAGSGNGGGGGGLAGDRITSTTQTVVNANQNMSFQINSTTVGYINTSSGTVLKTSATIGNTDGFNPGVVLAVGEGEDAPTSSLANVIAMFQKNGITKLVTRNATANIEMEFGANNAMGQLGTTTGQGMSIITNNSIKTTFGALGSADFMTGISIHGSTLTVDGGSGSTADVFKVSTGATDLLNVNGTGITMTAVPVNISSLPFNGAVIMANQLVATNSPADTQVPKYNAATGKVTWSADSTGGSSGLPLPEGATNYIQSSTSTTGGVFHISSGTVESTLTVKGGMIVGGNGAAGITPVGGTVLNIYGDLAFPTTWYTGVAFPFDSGVSSRIVTGSVYGQNERFLGDGQQSSGVTNCGYFQKYIPQNFFFGSTPTLTDVVEISSGLISQQSSWIIDFATQSVVAVSTGLTYSNAVIVAITGTTSGSGGVRQNTTDVTLPGITNLISSGDVVLIVRTRRDGANSATDPAQSDTAIMHVGIAFKMQQ